jgi:energy-coupling factor transport system substrate-specific component
LSWQAASFAILAVVLVGGFVWYERSRPPSQVVALVAALAALAIAGRIAFAAFPNVKPTTDIVIFSGFALGPAPGFAVGALTALVSNFWFGQGPWTPWQMLGWGLCGVLGAALALGGRNVARLTLAAACGLAGIAYGALLNFSLMATYGGELSLERFLAFETRGIPFDAAHAIANFAFALVAGPAMVRMLIRFRERFEWRIPAFAGSLLAMLALAFAVPAQAQAADPGRAASWLVGAQNADGGWGTDVTSASSVSTTCWVMLGLEAAGRNPLDITKGGNSPVDFLRRNVGELSSPGDFARTILALEGAGVGSRSFAGRDLVEALLKRRRTNGSYEGWPNSTAFAVIALRTAGATGSIDTSVSWLAKVQNNDGGWGDVPGSPSTPDGTGAVMQAMPDTESAERGLGFLRKAQRENGGFSLGRSGAVNAQSTAWAVQGMLAVGADPGSIRSDSGKSALDYLAARQAEDGHYVYSSSSDQTPVWVTGQVLAAVSGESFPVPVPPREPKPASPETESGSGGGVTPLPGSLEQGSAPSGTGGTAPGLGPGLGGGSAGPVAPPSAGAVPSIPTVPPTEGVAPESVATEPASFTASPPEGPAPWIPVLIGLLAGGGVLGGVIWLGRRNAW